MPRKTAHSGLLACGVMILLTAQSIPASVHLTQTNLEVIRALASSTPQDGSFEIMGVAISAYESVDLQLESFEVFAPRAVIVDHTIDGDRFVPVPSDRYFRGKVVGNPDSAVFLATGPTVRGLIFTGGRLYALGGMRDAYRFEDREENALEVRQFDAERDSPSGVPLWQCDLDSHSFLSQAAFVAPDEAQKAPGAEAFSSTVYAVNVAIETDYELYAKFGSTSGLTRYVGDLVAASSVIYRRDILTVLQIPYLSIWSGGAASDPWTASSTISALYQVGDYWHLNRSGVTRSTTHFLSGKSMGGGVAWLGVLCYSDFTCTDPSTCGDFLNHWGGGYAVSAGLNGQFSTTNPNLYWDLLCFSHELGHNFNSPHTHCYSPAIDQCWNTEPGCFTGALCGTTGQPPCNHGTIMSYCHQRSGGYSNIDLIFGQAGQPSQAVTNLMRTYVESLTSCLSVAPSAPTYASISPTFGSTSGGTGVTITGTGFQQFATVTIGGVAATNVVIAGNGLSLTANTGAHGAALVNVVIQNTDSLSVTGTNAYTYGTAPAPTITTVNPNFGPAAGSTAVTINGTNFVAGLTVRFGGTSATVGTITATTIAATTPAHTTGLVNVVVQNPDTQSATLANGYFYGPPSTALVFYTLTPCRVLDTRNADGPLSGPVLASNGTRAFTVLTTPSTCSIPLTAKVLSVNITALNSTTDGELRIYPGNGLLTSASAISYKASLCRANNLHLLLATDGSGSLKVFNSSTGSVHFVVDVNGYYQ